MATIDTNQLQELLEIKERRLFALEKQNAAYGLDTPAHISIELDLLRPDIQILRNSLKQAKITPDESHAPNQGYPFSKSHRWLRIVGLGGLILCISIILFTIYFSPLPIEMTKPYVTAYSGIDSTDASAEGAGNFSMQYDEQKRITYFVRYALPMNSNTNVWSGITFKYPHGTDLTPYKALELTIHFDDPGADCNLVMVNATQAHEINLKNVSSNRYVHIAEIEGQRTIRIDLDKDLLSFQPNMITEIKFETNASFPRGEHAFWIRDIHLLR